MSTKVKVVQGYSKWVLLATVGLVGNLMDDVDVSHLCVVAIDMGVWLRDVVDEP